MMELKMCNNCGNFTWNNGWSPMPHLCVECHFADGIDGPSNWVPKTADLLITISEQPTIEAEPTLRKLLNGEWVDTEEVQTAFGIDFATGMSLFELSREAEWNKPPLNGQKITTRFRIKAEPVRHAKWFEMIESVEDGHTGEYYEETYYNCMNCDYATGDKTPYCPYCGAKMDLEDKP